jgi:NAD(P) transhydrogenase subunit alpha
MIIAAMHEPDLETRVAITPMAVKNYIKLGLEVLCEQQAGELSGFSDTDYEQAGATVLNSRKDLLNKTNILVTVNEPHPKRIQGLQPSSLLISQIENTDPLSELLKWCCKNKISLFSLNQVPRISRAQNIDSLSSQANLAGYRAVIEAVTQFNRAVPMMMTAAGMIHPAKILILGAGVAGLQAIATAKRLGAVVYAFDVRAAAKEQVNSLGAEFIEVGQEQESEATGGYAKETSHDYQRLQAELIDQYARLSDIVICTALIPGKKAPVLISKKTVEQMKPGSVLVDLATGRGGNCELSERDKIIKYKNVLIIGYSNMAGLIPGTASDLYANNIFNLIKLLTNEHTTLTFNPDDQIIQQAMLCHEGRPLPFQSVKEI